ncbi:MAG TPA: hypothetical protein HPP95_03290 [Deltaproteobacteria bacterium]|nr:hypothetical protein [Deltaproteobacteria bacterium]
MATVTFCRALILGFVATLTESVTILHVPLFVSREICALVAGITFSFCLMLGMGKYSGFLACFGFQGDIGGTFVCGESVAGNSKTENKCEGRGTDNAFLHCSSPLIRLV